MKTLELGGKTFEVIKSNMHNVAPITGCNRNEIYNYYGKPSIYKVAIWGDWCDWCYLMNELGFECGIEIESANGFQFSITGSLRYKGEVWDLWITKSHNRLYRHK